jgi:hypothetical protein
MQSTLNPMCYSRGMAAVSLIAEMLHYPAVDYSGGPGAMNHDDRHAVPH